MTGECLISEAELAPPANERGNAHSEFCAKAEADGRQNGALNDDVSDAYVSSLANPLRVGAHEKTWEDIVRKQEFSAIRTDGAAVTERDLAGLLRKRRNRGDVRAKCQRFFNGQTRTERTRKQLHGDS